jgi:hypothetical protein
MKTIPVSDTQHRRLKLRATEEGRSLSGLVHEIVEDWLGGTVSPDPSVETPLLDKVPKEASTQPIMRSGDPAVGIVGQAPKQSVHEILSKVNRGKTK